jgi:hypothetical protein
LIDADRHWMTGGGSGSGASRLGQHVGAVVLVPRPGSEVPQRVRHASMQQNAAWRFRVLIPYAVCMLFEVLMTRGARVQ